MFKQLQYEYRNNMGQRLAALGGFILLFLAMLFVNHSSLWKRGDGAHWFATTMTMFGFFALLAIAAILAASSLIRIFSKPKGYLSAMTPVAGWKILLSRIIIIVLDFVVAIMVGTLCIAIQARSSFDPGIWQLLGLGQYFNLETSFNMLYVLLLGIEFIILIFFSCAVTSSFLSKLPASKILCVLVFFGTYWILSLTDAAFIPFAQGNVKYWKYIVTININVSSLPLFCSYLAFTFLKICGLFFATSRMIESKINL